MTSSKVFNRMIAQNKLSEHVFAFWLDRYVWFDISGSLAKLDKLELFVIQNSSK